MVPVVGLLLFWSQDGAVPLQTEGLLQRRLLGLKQPFPGDPVQVLSGHTVTYLENPTMVVLIQMCWMADVSLSHHRESNKKLVGFNAGMCWHPMDFILDLANAF